MAAPSSYTESMLRDYMYATTKGVADVVGWTAKDFVEAVNDTLFAYGVDDISDATSMPKLRALARVEAWRAMATVTAGEFDYSADSGQTATYYKRSQLHQQAKASLVVAQAEAGAYVLAGTGANAVQFGRLVYVDPYAPNEVE